MAKQLTIHGSKRRLRWMRRKLEANGFAYHKTSKYKASLTRTFSESEYAVLNATARKYKRKKGMHVEIRDERYVRSTNYRTVYFDTHSPLRDGRYRCIYCGHKLAKEHITVDHIFPVSQTGRSKILQTLAAAFGIQNVNDHKNLGAACESCNKKKGNRTGFWIIRAYIGKSEILWRIRFAIRLLLAVAILMILLKLCTL